MELHDPFWSELAGRYRPERPLGAGGMADVWLVHDERHGRLVALKLLGEHLASAMGQDRFKREIALLARLQHPNVLPLIDSGENAGRMWYVTPFIEGESLRDRLDREGKLDINEALRLGGELLDALGYAHRSGVVHRDIKPENVLLSQGHALLADFGIAREEGKDRLTATGLSVGTPSYMSPEQVAGEGAGAPSDLYSMGCVLFECLTGQPPFIGADARAVMAQHVMDPAPSLRARRPNMPEGVERVVLRALEKDPKDRWPDAAAFARALSEPAMSKADMVPSGARRAVSRRRRLWEGVGVVGAIALVAGGVLLWRSSRRIELGPNVTPRQVTFRGDVCRPFLSPNGRFVAFFAARQQWLMDLDHDRAWPVSDTIEGTDCQNLWGVPEARWLGDNSGFVYWSDRDLWAADTTGNRARQAATRQGWDSLRMAGRVQSRVGRVLDLSGSWPPETLVVRTPGRPPRSIVARGFLGFQNVNISPDGHLAYARILRTDSTDGGAFVDLDAERVVILGDSALPGWEGGWSGDSRALYVEKADGGALLRVEVDPRDLRPTRPRTALLPGIDWHAYWRVSTARDRNRILLDGGRALGRALVAHLPVTGSGSRYSVREAAAGSLEPLSASVSPLGNRLVFTAKADSLMSVFEVDPVRGVPRRVASLRRWATALRLSPDGSIAAVASRYGDRNRAILVDVRSGRVRLLAGWSPQSISGDQPTFDWDPSGRVLYAHENDRDAVVRLDLVTGAVDTIGGDSASRFGCPAASPRGALLAVGKGGGRGGVLLIGLSATPSRLLPRTPGSGRSCPLGWTGDSTIVVLEIPSVPDQDSSEIWIYRLDNARTFVGRLPRVCLYPALAPSGLEVVCTAYTSKGDVWIADDFDPYFRPPPAPPRRP